MHPTPSRGFTLVEVMVALLIMAVLSTMAWRGIDGIARTREAAQERMEQTLRMATVLAQWVNNTQRLADVTAGQWCAENQLAALRLVRRLPP
jgi:general secretion pathway protein J